MPSFFRVFRRDGAAKSRKNAVTSNVVEPIKPKWEEAWSRKEVSPEEVQGLIHVCTQEMKSRALDMPFLLLPFRPGLDTIGSKNFIRQYFKARYDGHTDTTAMSQRELRLMEPIVLCSIMKWCWSRLPGGVVSWETYELFRTAETDSKMAKNAFDVFIPMSAESDARKEIIFDYFDLLAAIAARGKTNGLGGRKLSRYAGWWAFEHSDNGKGFDGGYKSWAIAADATSHLFFAYLRALAPSLEGGVSGISKLPRSLQALLSQTEYPPETPSLMQSTTTKVVMIVESVSPTPFSLLRRARNFEYRDDDEALQRFSDYEDPVKALTDECRRVLNSISSTNQSNSEHNGNAVPDASWSRFEDMGFSTMSDSSPGDLAIANDSNGLRNGPFTRSDNMGRPTTPSWADFLSTGFPDDRANNPTLLPPDKQLPLPMGGPRGHSSQSHVRNGTIVDLEPGELASIGHFDLDETFWWVWMTSLAGEETAERKAVFGRCALIETEIRGAHWLVIEEQVKGASPDQEEGVYIAEKKSRFSFRSRGRLGRRKTTMKKKSPAEEPFNREQNTTPMSKIGADQHAKIHEAAAQLAKGQQPKGAEHAAQRRANLEEVAAHRNSVLTLQPAMLSEAGPALKWAKDFDSGNLRDKEDIKNAYLNDKSAGRGQNGFNPSTSALSVSSPNGTHAPLSREVSNRELPALPRDDVVSSKVAKSPSPPVTPPQISASKDAGRIKHRPLIIDDKSKVDDTNHPALRTDESPRSVNTQSPEQSKPSAELVKTTSRPDHPKKLQKREKEGGGGFKKLFGRKKPTPNDRSDTPVEEIKEEQKPVPKFKPIIPVAPQVHNPEPPMPAYESPPRSIKNEEPTFNEPTFEDHAPLKYSAREEARRDALERLEADREFSRFDQGPLEDQPSFIPEETPASSVVEVSPPMRSGHFGSDAAAAPTIPKARKNDMNTRLHAPVVAPPPAPDNHSDVSIDAPVQAPSDRWAQIRKNAAERAQRLNQEHTHGRNHSQSARSDDGETSGEETIESRVARIKARVAELTGNMDTSGSTAGVR